MGGDESCPVAGKPCGQSMFRLLCRYMPGRLIEATLPEESMREPEGLPLAGVEWGHPAMPPTLPMPLLPVMLLLVTPLLLGGKTRHTK